MFLPLAHMKMDIFQCSRDLVIACYQLTRQFPDSEKYGMVQQIRRAALSVHLNFSEGCSRRSLTERKRYYEISRGSVIEIDTALDISLVLNYCKSENLESIGILLNKAFSMLCGLLDE